MAESYQAFVARVNANAFLPSSGESAPAKTVKKAKKAKKAKLPTLQKLTERERELLAGLITGKLVLASIGGQQYMVRREGETFVVSSVHEPNDYVVENYRCTCPDSRFRERECKHVEAVRALLIQGAMQE